MVGKYRLPFLGEGVSDPSCPASVSGTLCSGMKAEPWPFPPSWALCDLVFLCTLAQGLTSRVPLPSSWPNFLGRTEATRLNLSESQ
jgi:hypothetical protein